MNSPLNSQANTAGSFATVLLRRDFGISAALLFLFTLILGCGTGDPPSQGKTKKDEDTVVKLQLNWYPEAEHGGYLAAVVHDFFGDENIKAEVLPGGKGVPVIRQVARKSVTFAIANADQVLQGRAQEAPIVAIFAPLQHSPRCIVVHESSGIKTFKDLAAVDGMTLSANAGKAYFQFISQKIGLTDKTKVVPFGGSVVPFLDNPKYAMQGYVFSEPFTAQQKGAKTHCLMVSETGFDPYTSVLITHQDTIDQQPELVRNMVAACKRGWQHYLQEPNGTHQHIHAMNKEMTIEALEFGLSALKPLCLPKGMLMDEVGQMKSDRWELLAKQMVETGAIKKENKAKAIINAYDLQFINR